MKKKYPLPIIMKKKGGGDCKSKFYVLFIILLVHSLKIFLTPGPVLIIAFWRKKWSSHCGSSNPANGFVSTGYYPSGDFFTKPNVT